MNKTLYIPISSLNFNEILSTESISPNSFYKRRGFGDSRWTIIPENNYPLAIVLYSELRRFKRKESDYDDYPIVIAISLSNEQVEQLEEIDNDNYFSKQTLFLSPNTTKFIFFSEEHRRIAVSKTNGMAEVKYITLYKEKCLEVRTDIQNEGYTYTFDLEPKGEFIETDIRINRLKGFLYCYYIGGILSVSKEDLKKTHLLKAIRNRVSMNLVEWQSKEITKPQDSELKSLVDAYASSNFNYNDLLNELSIYLNRRLTGEKEVENTAILKIEEELESLYQKLLSKEELLQCVSIEKLKVNAYQIENFFYEGFSEEENALLKLLCNDILLTNREQRKISQQAFELATEFTKGAKVYFAEKWELSPWKTVLNRLRRLLNEKNYSEWEWKEDFSSYLFAFLIKGDEWDKLHSFLEDKGLTDYRIALALYGCFYGFASLTRDFTDILFDYGLKTNKRKQELGEVKQKQEEVKTEVEVPATASEEVSVTASTDYERIKKAIKDSKRSPKEELFKLLENANNKGEKLVEKFIRLVNNVFKKSKAQWKTTLLDTLKDEEPIEEKIVEVSEPIDMFANQNTYPYFYSDPNAFEVFKDLIPEERHKAIKEDLEWFQDEIAKNTQKKQGRYSKVVETDNQYVIRTYTKYP